MRNEIEDLKQQAIEQGKQQLKQMAKESAKKVGQQIWSAIAPILPYIIIALVIIIIIVGLIDWGDIETGAATTGESVGTGWWWPIGSKETTTEGGKLFASGTPVDSVITSGVGPRWGRSHNGLDIASAGSAPGPYIIASKSGTVEYVIDGFGDNGYYQNPDGGGFGNHVIINHGDGMRVIYAHLSKNSITVSVGDTVDYGQVIAKMGNSGSSTGMHLHFQMELNGQIVDPEDYVSQDDPRPVEYNSYGSAGSSAALIFVMEGENSALRGYIDGRYSYNYSPYIYNYITKDKKYYLMGNDYLYNCNGNYGFGVCFFVESSYCKSNPPKGALINSRGGHRGSFQNTSYFKERGYDVRNNTSYQKYYVSKIPVDVVDDIKMEIYDEKREEVKALANSMGVTLKQHQIDVLADMRYQGWYVSGVISAYKAAGYKCTDYVKSQSSGFTNSGYRGTRRWILFSTGKYLDATGKEIVVKSTKSSNIIDRAKEIHGYMADKKYTYSLEGNQLATTFEKSKTIKKVCCATYVSWVLQDTKHISASEHTNGATTLYNLLKGKKWKEVKNVSNAQPGDVFFYSDNSGGEYYHTDIYAGNNKVWNAGNTNDIQSKNPTPIYSTPYKILRAP